MNNYLNGVKFKNVLTGNLKLSTIFANLGVIMLFLGILIKLTHLQLIFLSEKKYKMKI